VVSINNKQKYGGTEMIFNSVSYLLFFPVVVLLYFLMPQRFRNIWLLLASYFFYMNWNAAYALLLAGSTIITFVCSLLICACKKKGRQAAAKWVLGISLFLNLGILFVFKYSGFFADNINSLMRLLHQDASLSAFDVVLPVGISFYIFQALSYTIDVYRGTIPATKNLLRYALFVSFFPQLVAGPIERSEHLFPQFEQRHEFDVDRVRRGLLTMLWGLFMKIVIADNLSGIVTQVYENYLSYSGVEIVLATVLFAFQIYCDFGGYSSIAIGSARVLGFTLMENFDAPYLATSVNAFWKRWHISLTSWFRDYLYIPLGGNRRGKARKYLNVMLVFLVSGLWHGADWTYVIWGGLNGLYLVAEQMLSPLLAQIKKRLSVRADGISYRLFSGLFTFALVDFSWMFFRADSIGNVIAMLRQCRANPGLYMLFGQAVENWGLDEPTLLVLMLSLCDLLLVDVLRSRRGNLNGYVLSQGPFFRYCVYGALLAVILFFGVYGYEYAQTAFIYFQF
jgi:D-alanyl-lipoteichoic acid acyltransferase DltB (MBOAT superfamily)